MEKGKEKHRDTLQDPEPIQQLSSSISSSLRASLHLPHLSSIVSQLAFNSLDSGSKSIQIALDLQTWTVSCTDDGRGFHREVLDSLAEIGSSQAEPSFHSYSSLLNLRSKQLEGEPSIKYGNKGETLIDLAHLGLLQIQSLLSNKSSIPSHSSKARTTSFTSIDSFHEWTLLQKGQRSLYYGPTLPSNQIGVFNNSLHSSEASKRTTVLVRDLFHSLPVRRSALSSPNSRRAEIEKARKNLAVVALREPTVRFEFSVKECSEDQKERILLNSRKTRSILSKFSDLFGDSIPSSSMQEVSGVLPLCQTTESSQFGSGSKADKQILNLNPRPHLVLDGFISLVPSPSRSHQLVYLLGRPIPPDTSLPDFISEQGLDGILCKAMHSRGLGKSTPKDDISRGQRMGKGRFFNSEVTLFKDKSLHETINEVFNKSLFNYGTSTHASGAERSTSSSKHLRPAYVLDLRLDVGDSLVGESTLETTVLPQHELVSFLVQKVSEALRMHGLLGSSSGRADQLSKSTSSPTTSRVNSVTQLAGYLDIGSKIPDPNEGLELFRADAQSPVKRRKHNQLSLGERVELESLRAASLEFQVGEEEVSETIREEEETNQEMIGSHESNHSLACQSNPDRVVETPSKLLPEGMDRWIDPISKRSYLLDQRTGNSLESHRFKFTNSQKQSSSLLAPSLSSNLLSRNAFNRDEETVPPSWLAVLGWKSPLFDSSIEEPNGSIPQLGKTKRSESKSLQAKIPRSISHEDGHRELNELQDEDLEIPISSQSKSNVKTKQLKSAETKRRAKLALPAIQSQSRFFIQDDVNSRDSLHHDSISKGSVLGNLSRFDPKPVTLERDFLKNARVVDQVDRKFIACVLVVGNSTQEDEFFQEEGGMRDEEQVTSQTRDRQNDSQVGEKESLLVFLDQHATDERIRVERFLSRYLLSCLKENPEVHTFVKPTRLTLSQSHIYLLSSEKALLKEMSFWGFRVQVTESLGPSELEVFTVPEVVRERLTQSKEATSNLKELIISLVATWQDGDRGEFLGGRKASKGQLQNEDWLPLLRHVPPRLLDLINSKACRGAIMFNDELSLEESSTLIGRLSKTRFPFQCAHGRPSLSPICSLGSKDAVKQGREVESRRRKINWEKIFDL